MRIHELFEDYKQAHSAPDAKSGSPLHDVSETYGDDIYGPDAVNHYGQGYPYSSRIISKIKSLRGKPNAGVSVYRAVPKGVKDINPGDWVTLAKEYAEEHGKDNLGGNFRILHKIISAKNLFTDGSIHEWGWDPSNT